MKKSLGLIETQGLAAGIEAADAAVKSANVELIGYELTRGGGWTTIKVQGDVGAVKAAVDAARMAAAKVNQVVSTRVIPRPSAGLDMLVHNPDTVGDTQPSKGPDMPEPPTPSKRSGEVKEEEKLLSEPEEQKAEQIKESQPVSVPEQVDEAAEKTSVPEVSVEDAPETEPDNAEVSVQETEAKSADTPVENVLETEPDSVEAPVENTQEAETDNPSGESAQEAIDSEAEEGEGSPEQESQETAAPKPAKKAASKGRKGGKRGSKQENAE
ncbi:MAG: BMC domain-containing protein [Lachnospiraceae bacterium]|nr:BMC domain-containing protein [Lachnospiraceae bacterium]